MKNGETTMFVNEYIMDRRRYDKWATPKFWKLPVAHLFFIYTVLFLLQECSAGSILEKLTFPQDGRRSEPS